VWDIEDSSCDEEDDFVFGTESYKKQVEKQTSIAKEVERLTKDDKPVAGDKKQQTPSGTLEASAVDTKADPSTPIDRKEFAQASKQGASSE